MAGPRRALRAALLLPLLAGVLAMHVLLLCSDGGADHAGHDGAPMAAMPSMSATSAMAVMPAMPMADAVAEHVQGAATTDVVATAAAVLARDVAGTDPSSLLGMCLAVVTAGLVLALLGLRSTPVTGPRAPHRLRHPGHRATRAPPPAPLRHLLCVSRT
ncbi:hypothetical protein KMZ32_09060 [Phycicoccus sp. MAQZ13P-2]|uniref:hypothetical protein n=1 Tax=Phycicoccus mangrovi TaxID=2840470 RepID=UPI001C003CD1|nr:hypothetical protein [Phycicoccus mangrovi]MBT9255236.1 hypothetical protein [Phycicoccus mangrovi]MBT9274220.1 hypothetical protein [Phycicoccus mangrovi]